MEPQILAYSEDLHILGMDISSDLSWGKYISGIAKSAAMRVGCLSRARKFILHVPPMRVAFSHVQHQCGTLQTFKSNVNVHLRVE